LYRIYKSDQIRAVLQMQRISILFVGNYEIVTA